jgi:hypothetical protein
MHWLFHTVTYLLNHPNNTGEVTLKDGVLTFLPDWRYLVDSEGQDLCNSLFGSLKNTCGFAHVGPEPKGGSPKTRMYKAPSGTIPRCQRPREIRLRQTPYGMIPVTKEKARLPTTTTGLITKHLSRVKACRYFIYFGVEDGMVVYANLCPEDTEATKPVNISTKLAPSWISFDDYSNDVSVGRVLSSMCFCTDPLFWTDKNFMNTSHRCKNANCLNPRHPVLERTGDNCGREGCKGYLYCKHAARCLAIGSKAQG